MKIEDLRKIKIFLLIGIVLLIPLTVFADDLSLSSDQADYYFLTGSNAKIPFSLNSIFPDTVSGTLQYSLTSYQDQGGYSLSQTSTQSQPFPVAPGRSVHALALSSGVPIHYEVNFIVNYENQGKDYAVALPPISVYFVSDQKEIKEEKKSVRSNTTEATKSPASSNIQNQMNYFNQQMAEMEQEQNNMLQQMMPSANTGMNSGSPSYSSSQNPDQALQNNQMSSSSSALMQQMSQETEEKNNETEQLKENMAQDPLLQEQAEELQKAGYNQTRGTIIPENDGKGELSAGFKDKSGNEVSLQGSISGSSLQSLTAQSSGEIPVPSSLESNGTWNSLKKSLASEGMTPEKGSIKRSLGKTDVNQTYTSPDGRNAKLTAKVNNGTVEEVKLIKDDPFPVFWFAGIILAIILVILCLGVSVWYLSSIKKSTVFTESKVQVPVDFRKRVMAMIDEAKIRFEDGDKKDGYVILGQAIRMFLSCRYGTGVSLTCEEILKERFLEKIPNRNTYAEILKSCSMVEYAKEEPDEYKFLGYLQQVREIISKESDPEI